MTFRLDNILEQWAEHYLPLSHDPSKNSKAKSFYRIKTINMENELMRNQNSAKSPAMAYSIIIDGEMNGSKTISYEHTIYFFARATSNSLAKNAKQDESIGIDQQQLMDEMVQDLLAFLFELRHTGKSPIPGQSFDAQTIAALKGLNLEEANWATIPNVVKFGEWHIMGLSIEQIVPRLLCINREKYKSE